MGQSKEYLSDDLPFIKGQIYHRKTEIHKFGGSGQSGIAPSARCPIVFIFFGDSGQKYGYADGWNRHGYFEYTGEGQVGNQEFVKGNLAIRDHQLKGRDLLIFQQLKKDRGRYQFIGYFNCGEWHIRENQPDREGDLRNTIVFHLFPTDGIVNDAVMDQRPPGERTIEELRKRAYQAGATPQKTTESSSPRTYYERSKDVRDYVLARANGICESCGETAPFNKKNGEPYLESHHTLRRTDGGPDHPRFVGGICPTCHKEIHYGEGGERRNTDLKERLRKLELVVQRNRIR